MTLGAALGRLVVGTIVLLAPAVGIAKPTPAQKCIQKKLAAAGRAAAGKVACVKAAVALGGMVDPLCVARAESRLLKAFRRAESKGDCGMTGGVAPVGEAVDACVAGLNGSVVPPTITSTTTTTIPRVPSFRGRIALEELSVDGYGQGLVLDVRFVAVADEPPPVWEETPGSADGCKVWNLSPAQVAAVSLNAGGFGISGATLPSPTCVFQLGTGYVCTRGAIGTGGVLSAGPAPGTAVFTYVIDLFSSVEIGDYLKIEGAAESANNGAFPIIAVGSPKTLTLAAPTVVPETLPASAIWSTRFGIGITPGVPDPGFLDDGDTITIALAASASGPFASFERSVDAGEDFTLDTPSTATLTALPLSGASFSIGCSGALGHCGASDYTSLVIRTTDAPVAGLEPTAMPAPGSKSIVIRCASGTGTTRTVPAAAAAYLTTSGATRIEARYARTNRVTGGTASAPYEIEVGHALAGYTTPPP